MTSIPRIIFSKDSSHPGTPLGGTPMEGRSRQQTPFGSPRFKKLKEPTENETEEQQQEDEVDKLLSRQRAALTKISLQYDLKKTQFEYLECLGYKNQAKALIQNGSKQLLEQIQTHQFNSFKDFQVTITLKKKIEKVANELYPLLLVKSLIIFNNENMNECLQQCDQTFLVLQGWSKANINPILNKGIRFAKGGFSYFEDVQTMIDSCNEFYELLKSDVNGLLEFERQYQFFLKNQLLANQLEKRKAKYYAEQNKKYLLLQCEVDKIIKSSADKISEINKSLNGWLQNSIRIELKQGLIDLNFKLNVLKDWSQQVEKLLKEIQTTQEPLKEEEINSQCLNIQREYIPKIGSLNKELKLLKDSYQYLVGFFVNGDFSLLKEICDFQSIKFARIRSVITKELPKEIDRDLNELDKKIYLKVSTFFKAEHHEQIVSKLMEDWNKKSKEIEDWCASKIDEHLSSLKNSVDVHSLAKDLFGELECLYKKALDHFTLSKQLFEQLRDMGLQKQADEVKVYAFEKFKGTLFKENETLKIKKEEFEDKIEVIKNDHISKLKILLEKQAHLLQKLEKNKANIKEAKEILDTFIAWCGKAFESDQNLLNGLSSLCEQIHNLPIEMDKSSYPGLYANPNRFAFGSWYLISLQKFLNDIVVLRQEIEIQNVLKEKSFFYKQYNLGNGSGVYLNIDKRKEQIQQFQDEQDRLMEARFDEMRNQEREAIKRIDSFYSSETQKLSVNELKKRLIQEKADIQVRRKEINQHLEWLKDYQETRKPPKEPRIDDKEWNSLFGDIIYWKEKLKSDRKSYSNRSSDRDGYSIWNWADKKMASKIIHLEIKSFQDLLNRALTIHQSKQKEQALLEEEIELLCSEIELLEFVDKEKSKRNIALKEVLEDQMKWFAPNNLLL